MQKMGRRVLTRDGFGSIYSPKPILICSTKAAVWVQPSGAFRFGFEGGSGVREVFLVHFGVESRRGLRMDVVHVRVIDGELLTER